MKVKLNTILAGPVHRGYAGEVIEVDAAFGKDLVSGNFAVEIKTASVAAPVVENAQSPEPAKAEKAVGKGGKAASKPVPPAAQ